MIYDYFKQLFAQVTNPAIDSIREEVIMSLECYIGPERNLLEVTPEHCHRLLVDHPIITNEELAALRHINHAGWSSRVIDITFDRSLGKAGLQQTLTRIAEEAEAAADAGIQVVVLSDRAISQDRVPVSFAACRRCGSPALGQEDQANPRGHCDRKRRSSRSASSLSAGCFGADAINPYLAFEALWQARRDGLLTDAFNDDDKIVYSYRKAVAKGMLKVMAKMGISTLQSYKGARF